MSNDTCVRIALLCVKLIAMVCTLSLFISSGLVCFVPEPQQGEAFKSVVLAQTNCLLVGIGALAAFLVVNLRVLAKAVLSAIVKDQ